MSGLPFHHHGLDARAAVARLAASSGGLLASPEGPTYNPAHRREWLRSHRLAVPDDSEALYAGWLDTWAERLTHGMGLAVHGFRSGRDLADLARWAHGALSRILDLEGQLDLARREHARLGIELAERDRQRDAARASEDRVREALAIAIDRAASAEDALAAERRAHAEAVERAEREAAHLRAVADAGAHAEAAWRLSAESALSALRTLEIAAGIRADHKPGLVRVAQ